MDKRVKEILEDLYAIDESLRRYQNKLEKLIEKLLMARPDVEINEAFKVKLRAELLSRAAEIKAKKALFWNFFNFQKFSYAHALSLFLLCALLIIPIVYYLNKPAPAEEPPVFEELPALANPASVFCEEQGGVLEHRMVEAGQKGFCIFEDGSECGQWEFFRGECQKGERFCKDMCGDGICQEIVCMAIGCPCSETKETCPEDCK